jgi:NAD(P)-dependent dehydrogenase (short-subunit alcohol dehydrogenase family)
LIHTKLFSLVHSGSGLGRGILLEFVRSGCTSILASDIDSEGLAETLKQAKKLDPTVKIVSMIVDVTNEEQVNQMVALAVKNFGRIEYSIHSAGISDLSLGRLDDSTLEGHCRVLDVNLKGVLLCERAVLGVMKTQELRILE